MKRYQIPIAIVGSILLLSSPVAEYKALQSRHVQGAGQMYIKLADPYNQSVYLALPILAVRALPSTYTGDDPGKSQVFNAAGAFTVLGNVETVMAQIKAQGG